MGARVGVLWRANKLPLAVTESQICRNEFVDTKIASLTCLGDLIQRYKLEVNPLMKIATTDRIKLEALKAKQSVNGN